MRKKILIYCWLLMPVVLLAYHYGPGQARLAQDEAARLITSAEKLVASEDWANAIAAYTDALAKIPATDAESRWKLRLAQSKARIHLGELPEAISDMDGLLTEMEKNNAPASLQEDVRTELATAEYYAAWLMRLEGAPIDEWTIQTESSRQHFRLLAEEKMKTDPAGARKHQENLEAVIRLARMDLSDLEAMPLPKQCKGCKNVSQKCRGQCQSKGKKPSDKGEKKDARGASSGQRPRGGS